MTRYGIDPLVALHLIEDRVEVPAEHALVAPNLLRSEALSLVHQRLRAEEITERGAFRLLDGVATMRIRLLGDRVSRATALRLAVELGLADTGPAEYLAVTRLQADALIALDPALLAAADGVVQVAPLSVLTG